MQRREFLQSVVLGAAAMQLPACTWGKQVQFLSAHNDTKGQSYIAGMNAQGQQQFSIAVPHRGHGMAFNPAQPQHAVFVSRRPGNQLQKVDLVSGEIVATANTAANRHFFGHAYFSPDGQYLFTPENDFENGKGRIVVRNADKLDVVDEMPSYGVGPHEVHLLSDGKTLVVANGGILTHPSTPREKLNINTMKPSLSYIDTASGKLVGDYRLANHQLSIRHIDVSVNDDVAIAMQYEGDKAHHPALIAVHRGQDEIKTTSDYEWDKLNHYTGSVAFSADGALFAVTSPRGHRLTIWNTKTHSLVKECVMQDVCGVAWDKRSDSFIATTGTGYMHRVRRANFAIHPLSHLPNVKWDNHLLAI